MSRETLDYLRTNIRVGYTERDGRAWWGTPDDGAHFPGPVPIEAIESVFSFEPELYDVVLRSRKDGSTITADEFLGVVRSDMLTSDGVMGIHGDGYQDHGYRTWLHKAVKDILDSDFGCKSVGLLRGGRQAFLQAEMPDSMEVEGIKYNARLLGSTSLDGSLATTYAVGIGLVVCDNTRDLFMASAERAGKVFKVKHTANSLDQLSQIRDKLGLTHTVSEAFEAETRALLGTEVNDRQFGAFLDLLVELPEKQETKGGGPGRGYTMAENKRDALTDLWHGRTPETYLDANHDDSWPLLDLGAMTRGFHGNAFGVVQATNTYDHHMRTARGIGGKAERNISRMVKGNGQQSDGKVLDLLSDVLERKLVVA